MALALASAACARTEGSSGWTASVDTLPNGALHVINVPPNQAGDPEWLLQEEMRIGSVDEAGPASFGDILAIAVAHDGRIAVLDAQAQEIRVFDAKGKHVVTHGRAGAGPGEFRGANGMMLGPDARLWVPDHTNARLSVIDFDSGFVTSHAMEMRSYGYVWDGALTPDGRIIEPTSTASRPRRAMLRIYKPDMTSVDSLLLPEAKAVDPKNPPTAFFWESPARRSSGYITIPFVQSVNPVITDQAEVWSASIDGDYRIARWKAGGDTTLVIETRRPPLAVSAAERDSAIESIRSYLRKQGAPPEVDWSRVPQFKPQAVRMFRGDDDGLWVETSSPDSLTRFDVYDRDGRMVRTVASPAKWRKWVQPVVRGDYVWGVVVDDMDVLYVVRAKLVRPHG